MSEINLQRYSRHLVLPAIDVAGQQLLLDSKILIVGAGGLGSAAALYLAAAGIGHLQIADPDTVELSNLQRQILHTTPGIGSNKAQSACTALHALNPEIEVIPLPQQLEASSLPPLIAGVDLVLDCSDNFATRFAVNQVCVAQRKPLVSGAAIRFEGQVTAFTPGRNHSPCYRCLYAEAGPDRESCEAAGVLGPLVGIIGSLQAAEAIKLLLGIGDSLVGRLLLFDVLKLQWREVQLKPDPNCPVCHHE